MLSLLFALSAPAPAQQLATLTDGTPEFENCLAETDDCAARFYRFLTHSMVEQGFTFQEVSLLTSPITNRRDGPVVKDVPPAAERGRYLVEGLGHCGECHTPQCPSPSTR